MARTILGIDWLLHEGVVLPGRVGALCNATSVSSGWLPTAEALARVPGLRLARIFSPQHGFAAEKQDNMIESGDGVHPGLGVPIVSLYGARRDPEPAWLEGLDTLIVDLQDCGTRVYTFLVTAVLLLRAAAQRGLPVVVLDRPNPIGGAVEGPVLEEAFRSFVGIVDVPLRHGLTPGEFCRYAAWRSAPAVAEHPPHVVLLENWSRSLYHDEAGLPWTMPSPNLPTLETAVVYPGQVLLEGTNLSEGRGTTRPFEIFGAPYFDPARVLAELRGEEHLLDGARLREVAFEPTHNKYAGRLCRGFQLHVADRREFRPVAATVAVLAAARRAHPDAFAWREPPYEYEHHRLPIDLICGTDRVRRAIDAGEPATAIVRGWEDEARSFRDRVRPFLLYPGGDDGRA
jgi:uncharacterized protein YbbC (DUF1343 family)